MENRQSIPQIHRKQVRRPAMKAGVLLAAVFVVLCSFVVPTYEFALSGCFSGRRTTPDTPSCKENMLLAPVVPALPYASRWVSVVSCVRFVARYKFVSVYVLFCKKSLLLKMTDTQLR